MNATKKPASLDLSSLLDRPDRERREADLAQHRANVTLCDAIVDLATGRASKLTPDAVEAALDTLGLDVAYLQQRVAEVRGILRADLVDSDHAIQARLVEARRERAAAEPRIAALRAEADELDKRTSAAIGDLLAALNNDLRKDAQRRTFEARERLLAQGLNLDAVLAATTPQPVPRTVRALQPCYIDHVLHPAGATFAYSGPPSPGVIEDVEGDAPTTRRVRITRPFTIDRRKHAVGEVLDWPNDRPLIGGVMVLAEYEAAPVEAEPFDAEQANDLEADDQDELPLGGDDDDADERDDVDELEDEAEDTDSDDEADTDETDTDDDDEADA